MTTTTYSNRILVPTDFTPQAHCALRHAGAIAKRSGFSIILVHIVDNKTKGELKKNPKTQDDMEAEMKSWVSEVSADYGVQAEYRFIPGNIFTTIGEVAQMERVNLVVMGTHGVRGMQHVLGAFALKVITSSPVPTIVVQDKNPENMGYDKIVYPVDESRENKHKLIHAIHMAEAFNAEVHLLPKKSNDAAYKKHTHLNLGYSKKQLEKHGVKVVVVDENMHNCNSHEETIAYCKEVNSKLVVIRSTKEKKVKEYIVGPESVKMINNNLDIPVMVVNPIENLYQIDSAVMLRSK